MKATIGISGTGDGFKKFCAGETDISDASRPSPFTVLPIQISNWASRPQPSLHVNAAAGIVVLPVVLLMMNATAIVLCNRCQLRS